MLPAALASILALAAMSGQSFRRHQVVLATEAAQDLSAQQAQIQAGTLLVRHTTGLILLDIVQNERVGLDVVDRTIYDGTREAGTHRWAAVLRNPQAYGIRVIVMRLPNPAAECGAHVVSLPKWRPRLSDEAAGVEVPRLSRERLPRRYDEPVTEAITL